MQKIYTLSGVIYYEGSYVIGCYSSAEKAWLASDDFTEYRYDEFKVMEITLDAPAKEDHKKIEF